MKRFLLTPFLIGLSLFAASAAYADQITTRERDNLFPRQEEGRAIYKEYDGCSGGLTPSGGDDWISSATGTGASVSAVVPTDLNDPCAVKIDLGTVATNDSGIRQQTAATDFGNGEVCTIAWIREVTVSDDANADFIARVGFSSADASPAEFQGFRYNDDVNGGEWQAVARTGASETATAFDTNIVYTAGTSRWFKTCVNAAANSVSFYHSTTGPYNMTLVRTETSNVSSSTMGAGVVLERTVGTAASTPMNINFLAFEFKPTTPRW